MTVDVRDVAQKLINQLEHEIAERKLQIQGMVKLYEGLIGEMEKKQDGTENSELAGSKD